MLYSSAAIKGTDSQLVVCATAKCVTTPAVDFNAGAVEPRRN